MSHGYYQLPTGRVAALEDNCPFPPMEAALNEPNGLIAIGGDLSAARLLSAYRQGLFPWFNVGEPVMWWSPNPRMVLYPDELKISKSLAKTLKTYHQNSNLNHGLETRINTAFQAVITACSNTPRVDKNCVDKNNLDKNSDPSVTHQSHTWISPEMITAYCELHRQNYAISAETWLDGALVGGCYGVKIGRMFYGESMFYTQTNASKVAFVHLVTYLKTQQVGMIDCQMKTPLLSSFGGREISREAFMQNLLKLID